MPIITKNADIFDRIKDIHNFNLSVADVDAWEANAE